MSNTIKPGLYLTEEGIKPHDQLTTADGIAGVIGPLNEDEAFSKWWQRMPAEHRYDFDSEGRGYKKDGATYAQMAWNARAALAADSQKSSPEQQLRAENERMRAALVKLRRSFDPDDWAGDQRMIDVADEALGDAKAAQPVKWGHATTAGKLVAQLQTFDPATPLHAGMHADYKGKRVAIVRPVSMSRERVAGRFIETGNEAVPYSLVIWAAQDEREAAATAAQPAIPPGWRLVPEELERAQWDAINAEDDKAFAGGNAHGADFETLWRIALDTAPKPPAAPAAGATGEQQ